jgi:choline dehydrogenase-like flavoprotein
MPAITGGNTNAPARMIGEHCATLMLRACPGTAAFITAAAPGAPSGTAS